MKKNKNQDLAAAMPPGQFRMILKYQASSFKRQASSVKHTTSGCIYFFYSPAARPYYIG
jgi:hypothetical protein